MKTYLDWLEFAEYQRQQSLVPNAGDSRESWECYKAFWEGYLAATRDANRYVNHKKA